MKYLIEMKHSNVKISKRYWTGKRTSGKIDYGKSYYLDEIKAILEYLKKDYPEFNSSIVDKGGLTG